MREKITTNKISILYLNKIRNIEEPIVATYCFWNEKPM